MGRRKKNCPMCGHLVAKHGITGCLMKKADHDWEPQGKSSFCPCDKSIKEFNGKPFLKKKRRGK